MLRTASSSSVNGASGSAVSLSCRLRLSQETIVKRSAGDVAVQAEIKQPAHQARSLSMCRTLSPTLTLATRAASSRMISLRLGRPFGLPARLPLSQAGTGSLWAAWRSRRGSRRSARAWEAYSRSSQPSCSWSLRSRSLSCPSVRLWSSASPPARCASTSAKVSPVDSRTASCPVISRQRRMMTSQ